MKKYILTDGEGRYIHYDPKGRRYVRVNHMNHADLFDTFAKAEHIRKTAIGKYNKHNFYTVTVEVEDPKPQQVEAEKPAKPAPPPEVKPESVEDNLLITFLETAHTLLTMKDELINGQSTVDREITDLQHYIEAHGLDAYRGFLAYKNLRNALIRRREIKDKLLILTIIEDCEMTPDSIGKTIKRIRGLDERQYTPRVLNELFERGIG